MIKSILQAAGILSFVSMLIYDWRMVPIAAVGALLLWEWWLHRPSVSSSPEQLEEAKK